MKTVIRTKFEYVHSIVLDHAINLALDEMKKHRPDVWIDEWKVNDTMTKAIVKFCWTEEVPEE